MAIEATNERLATEFVVWCGCYNLNPFDSRKFMTSLNWFSIETYREQFEDHQAKAIKQIVFTQKTAQRAFNRPHYKLPRCS
tara:strand:+ start:1194 stop:1436 length:243 start_codon:yes stop_codon:yes gene_type:complete